MEPCSAGVEPKLPVQSCVPRGNEPNDTMAMKFPLIAISGSLVPCPGDSSKGVFENARLPGDGLASKGSVTRTITHTKAIRFDIWDILLLARANSIPPRGRQDN